MPLALNYSQLCGELERLQKFGYRGIIDNGSAPGGEKAPFLPICTIKKTYLESV